MNKLYEESDVQNIANAIRNKNGSTTQYKISTMASAIDAIETGVPNVKRWDITVVDGVPSGSVGYIYIINNDPWLAENRANPNLCVMILPKFTVSAPSGSAKQGLWLCTNAPIITDSSNVLYKSLSAYVHRNGSIAARTRHRSLTAADNIGDLLITAGGYMAIMCHADYPVATGDYVVLAFIA